MIVTAITGAAIGLAVVLGAAIILRVGEIIAHHPGHHAGHRGRDMGMVAIEGGTGTTRTSVDVPVYPVERPPENTIIDLPVIVDGDDFYVEDELVEKVESVYERADRVLTAPPEGWTGPVQCSTTCDDDCKIDCHEEHLVTWRRDPDHTHWSPEPEIGPDPDPDATGEWVAVPIEPQTDHLMDYGDEFLDEITAEEWLQPLQTGTNGRAVRRLKSLMTDKGWTGRGQRETTPRRVGKRRKKRTLGRLNPVEAQRDRARRAAEPTGRHRRTEKDGTADE